jgi:hypothetical protein
LSGVAAASGVSAVAALGATGDIGVGGSYIAKQAFATYVYSTLTKDSLEGIPALMTKESQLDRKRPSTALSTAGSLMWQVGPSLAGERIGAITDALQFGLIAARNVSNLFSSSIQTRVSATNSINANSGGSSNQSKLWATPSGAVISGHDNETNKHDGRFQQNRFGGALIDNKCDQSWSSPNEN